VSEVSYDQGLYPTEGRGPEASGDLTACPPAEMWKWAEGPRTRGQRELLTTAGKQLVGPARPAAKDTHAEGHPVSQEGGWGFLRSFRKKEKNVYEEVQAEQTAQSE